MVPDTLEGFDRPTLILHKGISSAERMTTEQAREVLLRIKNLDPGMVRSRKDLLRELEGFPDAVNTVTAHILLEERELSPIDTGLKRPNLVLSGWEHKGRRYVSPGTRSTTYYHLEILETMSGQYL